jgi:PAS domain S-box-containing protein
MYIQINNGFTQIMGYTEGDVIGKSSIELNIWDDLQDRQKLVEGLMKEGSYKNLEAKFRGKDGKIVHRMMSSSVIQLNGIDHILSITRDITERKQADENLRRMEDRLRQSQKMDAIGQLASGVAHDFNNVLGGIIGYTELSLAYVEKKSVVEKNLQRILQASDRATHLVKQILTFSRQGNPQKLVISIRPILKEVLELLRASIPSSVVIEDDLQKNVKSVLADPTKIHEAVLNLATNAVHAMNRKGVLTIRLFAEILDHPEYGWIGELAPGEYTVIEVADTGCGMDAATLSKAFDPFFTTKPVGEGTGMGLSVVHGVVQSNGGDISIESTVGKGTTIRIYLPVTEELIAQKGDTDTHAGPMGHERILFVDDEQMLIDMNKELLTGQGYTVTCRKHSGEALSYIRENAGEIDILVTDQTMPGMTGIELAKEALTIRHDLPIILCTGFSSDVSADHATTLGIKRVVMKPYRSHTLCDSIREVLDAHA